MGESFTRKTKARTAERWMRNPVRPSSCVTPAGTSNELDVQNEWEENTHTHIHAYMCDHTYSSTVLLQIHSLEESPAGRGHPPPPPKTRPFVRHHAYI